MYILPKCVFILNGSAYRDKVGKVQGVVGEWSFKYPLTKVAVIPRYLLQVGYMHIQFKPLTVKDEKINGD